MDASNVTLRCGGELRTVRRQVAKERGYADGAIVGYDDLLEMLVESSALAAAQHEISVLMISAGYTA